MKFLDYMNLRVKKFGISENNRFKKVEDGLFEYDSFLAINMTPTLSNVKFYFVTQKNGKYYYRDEA